jgi:hypothetical protein
MCNFFRFFFVKLDSSYARYVYGMPIYAQDVLELRGNGMDTLNPKL